MMYMYYIVYYMYIDLSHYLYMIIEKNILHVTMVTVMCNLC